MNPEGTSNVDSVMEEETAPLDLSRSDEHVKSGTVQPPTATLRQNFPVVNPVIRSTEVNVFRDGTMLENCGLMIQFLNYNCPNQATVIGASRMPFYEGHRLTDYLSRNRNVIKGYAIRHLKNHFDLSMTHHGVGETITTDDFGCTYMIQNTTSRYSLHPENRFEAGLWTADFDSLLTTIPLNTTSAHPDDVPSYMHFILVNCYIHLNERGKRLSHVRERLQKEKAAAEAQALKDLSKDRRDTSDRPLPAKKEKTMFKKPTTIAETLPGHVRQKPQKLVSSNGKNCVVLTQEEYDSLLVKAADFPELPKASPPTWELDGLTKLPPLESQV